MKRSNRLDYAKRKKIEELLTKGVTVKDIAAVLDFSHQAIYREIKQTISPEDYAAGRYYKYSALKAQLGPGFEVRADDMEQRHNQFHFQK